MAYCAVCWTVEKRIGVGTESPSHPIHVYDGGNSVYGRWERSTGNMYIGSDSIGGALGATGNIPLYFWTGDGTERMRIACQGNVGIGTTSPTQQLHIACSVVGNMGITVQNLNASYSSQIRFLDSAGTEKSAITFVPSDTGLYFYHNGSNRMVINSSGNVGIGTTSPGTALDVTGTIRTTPGAAGFCADHTYLGITYRLGTGEVSDNIDFRICGGSAGGFTTGGNFRWHTQVGNTAPTERMRITPSGNVGIGTTSPNAILHVQGSSADGTATFRVTSTSAPSSFNYAGSLINGCLCSNRNYILLIGQDLSNKNSGYIGYNHTGTANSNNNFLTFGHFQSDNLLNLLGNGNLGVGTTTPSYRLHVNGTFYAAGSSIKYKEGICHYDTNSCLFMCLKPVAYQYKDEFKHLGKELKSDIQIGLIAEDVAEVMPELAVLVNEEDEKVVRNVDYEKLSIVLLAEVQKLRREVDTLKNN